MLDRFTLEAFSFPNLILLVGLEEPRVTFDLCTILRGFLAASLGLAFVVGGNLREVLPRILLAVFLCYIDLHGIVVSRAGLLIVKLKLNDLIIDATVKIAHIGLLVVGVALAGLSLARLCIGGSVAVTAVPMLVSLKESEVKVVRHLRVLLLHLAEICEKLSGGYIVPHDFDFKGLLGLHGILSFLPSVGASAPLWAALLRGCVPSSTCT